MTNRYLIRFRRHDPDTRAIQRITRHLTSGGLAVIPSETQYALSGDATSPLAIAAIRTLKGRDASKPLSIFLSGPGDLPRWGMKLAGYARILAEHFWPGPITLVLPTSHALAAKLGSPGAIGVRVSPEPILKHLLTRNDRPLLATSANPSGAELSVDKENRWLEQLTQSGAVLWGRPLRYVRQTPSTVVDCTGAKPRLLRQGAIPRHLWEHALTVKAAKRAED